MDYKMYVVGKLFLRSQSRTGLIRKTTIDDGKLALLKSVFLRTTFDFSFEIQIIP